MFWNRKKETSQVSQPVQPTHFVEPSLDMAPGQLRAAVEAKANWIIEQAKGKPEYFFEEETRHLVLDERKYVEPRQVKRVHAILDYIGGGNLKVLNVADGEGHISGLIKNLGHDVTVTDISAVRVMKARFLNKLKAVRCKADKLPFPDETFDIVVAGEILEHGKELWPVIKECERVAKKTGKVIFTVPINDKGWDGYSHHLKHIDAKIVEDSMLIMSFSNILAHFDNVVDFELTDDYRV